MAAPPQPPLDEIAWAAPEFLVQTAWGRLTSDAVYHYFAQSPFYDPMSNNGVIITQAASGLQTMVEAWWFRRKFEAYLRTLNGLEFMVIEDPTENGTKEEHSGVWVIRKQIRSGERHDVITPISCYMIIGDVIIMAPTMMNVLSSRLISSMSSLNKYFSKASTLPLYTPSVGHTWFPPTAKPLAAAINPQPGQASKEGTPMPGTPTTSVNGDKAPLVPKAAVSSEYKDLQVLAESYHLSLEYGNEYMDETPLVGEPGTFRMNKPREVVPKPALAPKPVLSIATPFAQAPTDDKTAESPVASKKGKGAEKSPVTPGTKEKKNRRKSKAAGAASTTTPK